MLHKAKTLKGYALDNIDGDIGTWLAERQVLISPYALRTVDEKEQLIAINLTKAQIEKSPPLDSDKPVSRQFEASYNEYYGWAMYWIDKESAKTQPRWN